MVHCVHELSADFADRLTGQLTKYLALGRLFLECCIKQNIGIVRGVFCVPDIASSQSHREENASSVLAMGR